MLTKPSACWTRIAAINFGVPRMEGRTVVHVGKMGDLMSHGGLPYKHRGADEPPTITDIAIGRTASPAGAWIAHADLTVIKSRPLCIISGFAHQRVAREFP